jgi:hypothetical protein
MHKQPPVNIMKDSEYMFEALFEKAKDYGKTTLELTKLESIDKSTDMASGIIPHSFILITILFCLACFTIGCSLYLGEMLGKIYYGYFVMAGFYIIAGMVLYLLRNTLQKITKNYLIKLIFK